MRVVRRAVIALGSNLGDREATIRAAVRDIDALDGVHGDRGIRPGRVGALKLARGR